MKKNLFCALSLSFVLLVTGCGNSLSSKSDVYAEIMQYEWTDMYKHKKDYEEVCGTLFTVLPQRLFQGDDLIDSLEIKGKEPKRDKSSLSFDLFGKALSDCFIPAYGGVYMDGIKMNNRHSFEECYEKTIEVISTLHKEYIEMGIIEKKSDVK